MTDKKQLIVLNNVYPVATVSMEPVTVMSVWSLMQVTWASGERSRHLVGRANRTGRVCSDIRQFDLEAMTATTHSGRRYRLVGEPGHNRDGFYVFEVWLGNQDPVKVRNMTRALLRLLRQRQLLPNWH